MWSSSCINTIFTKLDLNRFTLDTRHVARSARATAQTRNRTNIILQRSTIPKPLLVNVENALNSSIAYSQKRVAGVKRFWALRLNGQIIVFTKLAEMMFNCALCVCPRFYFVDVDSIYRLSKARVKSRFRMWSRQDQNIENKKYCCIMRSQCMPLSAKSSGE